MAIAFIDEQEVTVGDVLDSLIAGNTLEVNGMEFKVIKHDIWDAKINVYKLCNEDKGDIKYYVEVNLDDFIRIFEGQDITIKRE